MQRGKFWSIAIVLCLSGSGCPLDVDESDAFIADGDADSAVTWGHCGDELCQEGESASTCPVDCPALCGDGVCTHHENTDRCPPDCPWFCGNAICEGEETVESCPGDCPAECGDGRCSHEESLAICEEDCSEHEQG